MRLGRHADSASALHNRFFICPSLFVDDTFTITQDFSDTCFTNLVRQMRLTLFKPKDLVLVVCKVMNRKLGGSGGRRERSTFISRSKYFTRSGIRDISSAVTGQTKTIPIPWRKAPERCAKSHRSEMNVLRSFRLCPVTFLYQRVPSTTV